MTEIIDRLKVLAPARYEAERAVAILDARAAGLTWRVIAEALGMTQLGVQRIAKRSASD